MGRGQNMRGLCLMIISLSLQCTDDIQQNEMSSQTQKKTFLLIKAVWINNLLKTEWEPQVTIRGGHRHFPKSRTEDLLRCFSSRRVKVSEVKRQSVWRVVESSWKIVQTRTQLLPDLGHPRQFAFVFLKKSTAQKGPSELKDLIIWINVTLWLLHFSQKHFWEHNLWQVDSCK